MRKPQIVACTTIWIPGWSIMKNRRSRFTIGCSSFLFLAGWLISPLEAQTFLDRLDSDSFRVVTYNMFFDDLFDHPDTAPDELARMISAVDADVYNFQEVFDTSEFEVQALFDVLAPLGGNTSWQVHKARNQVIVSRYDLSMKMANVPGGTRGIAMALVDLPDAHFSNDFYILNNHFPCCNSEPQRVIEARAIVAWVKDATTPGGNFDLPQDTAISVLGDLNIVGGPQPLDILLHGENGPGPDWDGSSNTASQLFHNGFGIDQWTWRNDQSQFDPGILDYVLFTDSAICMQYGYILNPSQMTSNDLTATGLQATDFMLDKDRPHLNVFDHLPLIVDFVSADPITVLVDSFDVTKGRYAAGTISDLDASDDSDLVCARNNSDTQSRVYVEVKGTSSIISPAQFTFTLEASVFARSTIVQSIELWNFNTNQFEEVDTRNARFFSDLVTTVAPAGDLSRFVDQGTGCVEARIRFQSNISRQKFSASIDQIRWSVEK